MSERITAHVDADLRDLIPGFLANRARDVVNMRAALTAGQLDSIRIAGHSMKGVGGGYGFDGITEIGAAIEKAALAGDLEAVGTAVDRLADYLDRVEVVFDGES
jgi:HPt (histidine-containing phosphotransfer) domain-containing protein